MKGKTYQKLGGSLENYYTNPAYILGHEESRGISLTSYGRDFVAGLSRLHTFC